MPNSHKTFFFSLSLSLAGSCSFIFICDYMRIIVVFVLYLIWLADWWISIHMLIVCIGWNDADQHWQRDIDIDDGDHDDDRSTDRLCH